MPRRDDIAGRKPLIISSGRKRLVTIAMLLLFLVAMPWPTLGCMRSLATIHVSSDFRVVVRHRTTPIPGIKVAVYDKEQLYRDMDNNQAAHNPVLTLVTSSDGSVEIKNLRKGSYVIETTGPGAGSAVEAVVGDQRTKNNKEVALEWPYSMRDPIKANTLSGQLASSNPWKPFENVHLELWTAGIESPLAIEETGPEGRFRFGKVELGLYVLRIHSKQKNVDPDRQIEGEIVIELTRSSKALPEVGSFYLGMTTCGITYSKCPFSTFEALPSRRFQVHDPHWVVIPHTKYRVLDLTGTELAAGVTDSDGIVELSSELNGKVTLVVAGPGSTVFALPLNLLTPDDTAPYLAIVMGVQGYGGEQCSAANLENHATQR